MKTFSDACRALLVTIVVSFPQISISEEVSTTLVHCNKPCDNDAHLFFAACMPATDPFVLDENGLEYRRRNLRQFSGGEHRDLQIDCTPCEVAEPPNGCCIVCPHTCGGCGSGCGGGRRELTSAQDIAENCEDLFDSYCNNSGSDSSDSDDDGYDLKCTATVYENMSPEDVAEEAENSLP